MAGIVLPSATELMEAWNRCVDLRQAMKERSAGGTARSGRYRSHDSARLKCLDATVEPKLRMGILPTTYDSKMLFDYPGPNDIVGPAKLEMDSWAKQYAARSSSGSGATAASAAAAAAISVDDQATLLNWIRVDAPASVSHGPVRAQGGRPKTAFKIGGVLTDSRWKLYTIAQLQHESKAPRGFLRWLIHSEQFVSFVVVGVSRFTIRHHN